jgi:urease accessory protein
MIARGDPVDQTSPAGNNLLPNSSPAGVRASLRLEFQFDPLARRTRLVSSLQEPPLRVVRAFEHDEGAALVHLHNVSGGLLGGDHLSLYAEVGREARVQITTTGATRLYRPRESAPAAIQSNEIVVGEGALLEYVPDPLIPFAGARLSQRTKIHLARDAGLFWWEIIAPGREARGEVFEYERLEMGTDITSAGRLIAAERVGLEPKNRSLSSLARLGPYRTWATFYICREGLEGSTWLDLEQHLRQVAAGLQHEACSRTTRPLWGISTLPAHGLAVRCAAVHGRDVFAGLQALWLAAKLRLYGRAPVLPRKVN